MFLHTFPSIEILPVYPCLQKPLLKCRQTLEVLGAGGGGIFLTKFAGKRPSAISLVEPRHHPLCLSLVTMIVSPFLKESSFQSCPVTSWRAMAFFWTFGGMGGGFSGGVWGSRFVSIGRVVGLLEGM